MKILMVNKFLHQNGGSETYTFGLGEYLNTNGNEVQYFGMDHPNRVVGNKKNIYTKNMDFHGSILKKMIYSLSVIYSIEAYNKIMEVLKDFEPDIVHINNFNYQLTPSILYAIRKYERKVGRRIKIIFTAHDCQIIAKHHMKQCDEINPKWSDKKKAKYEKCVKYNCIYDSKMKSVFGTLEARIYSWLKAYKMLDVIICPSEFLKLEFSQVELLKDKLITMHNFIPNRENNINIEEVVKSDYVLYFGRYNKEKGMGTLLEACKKLPEIKFVFAGDGPFAEKINEVDNIKNVGFLSGDELESTISKAKFSIYPSEWYENCPFAVIESQILGTPVLGADIGGIPEVINVNETGELFESGNLEGLINSINKLYYDNELLEKYQMNCKDYKTITIEKYVDDLMELYKK